MKLKRIALIACVGRKKESIAPALELYQSPLFKKTLAYCQSLKVDDIYILSAEYGLVHQSTSIAPYDKTLNRMTAFERRKWAESVLKQLSDKESINNTEFIICAGGKYRENLINHLPFHIVPMQSLGIGQQLQWLNQNTHF